MDLRSAPIRTLSFACSKSFMATTLRLARAAFSAASFTMLARSAPLNPGVPRARTRRSTSWKVALSLNARAALLRAHAHPDVLRPRGGRNVLAATMLGQARQGGWWRQSERSEE